jgi:putative membrane protein
MGFLVRLLINALALYLVTRIYSGVYFAPDTSTFSIVLAALVLGIVNALIRPVLLLLSLPINVISLGLFTLVVNGLMLSLVAAMTALEVTSFGAAIIGALVLAVVSWVLDNAVYTLGLDSKRNT